MGISLDGRVTRLALYAERTVNRFCQCVGRDIQRQSLAAGQGQAQFWIAMTAQAVSLSLLSWLIGSAH